MVNPKKLAALGVVLAILLSVVACKGKSQKSSLPRIGTPSVDFALQDLKGKTWKLNEMQGKLLLLRFWDDQCPYCRFEMPVIEKYYRKFVREGFMVLAVNVKQSPSVVEAFTAQLDLTFPVLLDLDGKVARAYGVYAIPTNFLVDRQGILREIFVGEVFKDENFLRGLLQYYFQN